jgi:hypothetical protein
MEVGRSRRLCGSLQVMVQVGIELWSSRRSAAGGIAF